MDKKETGNASLSPFYWNVSIYLKCGYKIGSELFHGSDFMLYYRKRNKYFRSLYNQFQDKDGIFN